MTDVLDLPAVSYTVRQDGDAWVVCDDLHELGRHATYALAVAQLAAQASAEPTDQQGLLADTWTGDQGLVFNQQPDPTRSMVNATWTWRDPAASLLPLMLQQETADGHDGAVLAGFITELHEIPGGVNGSGRFYDTEAGRQARDLLLGGRRFGVSADGGADTVADFVCTAEDADGFCTDGMWDFTVYDVAGVTMTPFPAFADASIILDGGAAGPDATAPEAVVAEQAVAAAAAQDLRVRPPLAWFTMPEPEFGDPMLVQQDAAGERWGVPLTITDEGQVYGHLALWGECLRGRDQVCISPPDSPTAYSEFLTGAGVLTAEGRTVTTGRMVVGCAHYPTSGVDRSTFGVVRDYYADAGLGWADVAVTSGAFGPWLAGRVDPLVTEAQLSVVRNLPPSGDWNRGPDGAMELCAVLSVNKPGFPVRREAIVAAALPPEALEAGALTRAHVVGGQVMALTAANRVSPCPECTRRASAARAAARPDAELHARLARMEALLGRLDRRTAHLNCAAIHQLRSQLVVPSEPKPGTAGA